MSEMKIVTVNIRRVSITPLIHHSITPVGSRMRERPFKPPQGVAQSKVLWARLLYYSFALVRIRTTSSIQSMASWQMPAAPLNHVRLGG